jgi:uncharacterized protein (DUF1330 family)
VALAAEETAVTAYWINTFTAIRDADRLAAYAALAGPAILAAGGEFLARGVPEAVFEGGLKTRSALIRFASVEAAVAAYHSAAYQEALVALGDGADRDIRIVPAVEGS